jgi:hypothetical protein
MLYKKFKKRRWERDNMMLKIRRLSFGWKDMFHMILGFVSRFTIFGFLIALAYFLYQLREKEEEVQTVKDLTVFIFGYCFAIMVQQLV